MTTSRDEGQGAEDVDLSTDPQFLRFLEANGGVGVDPLSDEALRIQAEYVKLVGDHPLDTLKSLSSNPWVKPSDRISAAKALLEYGARKVPATFELSGKDGGPISLTPASLSKLSAKDLDTLEKILAKVSGEQNGGA